MLKRMMKKERSIIRRKKAFLNKMKKLRRDGGAGYHIPENESLKFKFLPLSYTEITQHPWNKKQTTQKKISREKYDLTNSKK